MCDQVTGDPCERTTDGGCSEPPAKQRKRCLIVILGSTVTAGLRNLADTSWNSAEQKALVES